jgi:Na+/H+ antiporter NhaD/arsenite permease-like protein
MPMTDQTIGFQTFASVAIFLATYTGVAHGRIPGFRIDRAGIALVGASLMVAFGTLSLEEAYRAIDLDAITLLLGMMIIVAQLRLSGFFELASRVAIECAHGPLVLLGAIGFVTAFFSAFLVNDIICLVMTPLVIDVTRALQRNPVPYLLTVALASNAGSVATITGNPQNMIIGVASGISYVEFASRLAPVAAIAVASTLLLVSFCYAKDMSGSFASISNVASSHRHTRQVVKGVLITIGVIIAFFSGIPIAKAAIVGGSFLLVSRAIKPGRIYAGIDGRLLLMFIGLFVVVAGAEKVLLTPGVLDAVRHLHLENAWVLSAATALLSNFVSNVPAVLVLKPFVPDLPDPDRAWLLIAMSSTLAGNLTIIGSIANLIVAECAKISGVTISFLDHLRIGFPLALSSIAFATWWLNR